MSSPSNKTLNGLTFKTPILRRTILWNKFLWLFKRMSSLSWWCYGTNNPSCKISRNPSVNSPPTRPSAKTCTYCDNIVNNTCQHLRWENKFRNNSTITSPNLQKTRRKRKTFLSRSTVNTSVKCSNSTIMKAISSNIWKTTPNMSNFSKPLNDTVFDSYIQYLGNFYQSS